MTTSNKSSNDEDQIRRVFDFFQIDDEAFVTQTFKGENDQSRKVLVDNPEDLIEEANSHTAEGQICLSINPRNDAYGGTETVENLNNIVVDIDVKDEYMSEGVSTEEGKKEAKNVVREVTKDLEELGLSRDLLVDSGNGYHIYVGIDKEIDVESKDEWKDSDIHSKLSRLEDILKENNNDKVKVDTLTSDIARRMKIAGTHNVKPEISEENYRMAEILDMQEPDREQNTEALLDIEVPDPVSVDKNLGDFDAGDMSDSEKIQKAREFDDVLDRAMTAGGDRSEKDATVAEKAGYYGFDVEVALQMSGTDKYEEKKKAGYLDSYMKDKREVASRVKDSFDWSGQEEIEEHLELEIEKTDSIEDEFEILYPDNHFTKKMVDYMRPDGEPQTPRGYELSAGLFLLAVATDRNYRESQRNQQPNVVISYLGKSNVGKSFPEQYAKSVLRNTFVGSEPLGKREINAGTPAGLMKYDMNTVKMDDDEYEEKGDQKEKRFYLSDEATKFWVEMQQEEGMSTYLTDIIDHSGVEMEEVVKSTVTGKGENGVRRPFLNIFAGIQVSNFENVFNSDSVKQGVVGRMYVVDNIGNFSQQIKPSQKKQPPFRKSKLINQGEELSRRLSAIQLLGELHNMWGIEMTEEATDLWDSWVMDLENRPEVQSNDIYKSILGKSEGKVLKTALLLQIGSDDFYDHITDYIQALCKRRDVDCDDDEWKNVLDNGTRSGLEEQTKRSDMGKFVITEEAMRSAIYYHATLFIPSMVERIDEMMAEDSEERKVLEYMKRNADRVQGRNGSVINEREFNQAKYRLKLNKDLEAIRGSLRDMGYVTEVNEERNSELYHKLNEGRGKNAKYIFVKDEQSVESFQHKGTPEEIKTPDFLDF